MSMRGWPGDGVTVALNFRDLSSRNIAARLAGKGALARSSCARLRV
jgi:hypothetical protein